MSQASPESAGLKRAEATVPRRPVREVRKLGDRHVPDVPIEAELAGGDQARTARAAPVEAAFDYVCEGTTCANDVSARDLQLGVSQWTHGKAVDTFLPMGPCLVTRDEIADPRRWRSRGCELNGETGQSSDTAQMVFGVAELVSFISQTLTLEPGDVIATGTPAGVGWTRTPPFFCGTATR